MFEPATLCNIADVAKKLFVARWPDGTAWLVRARSMEEVADILDEEADPGACEVYPYDGPLVVELRLSEDRMVEVGGVDTDTGHEMKLEIIRTVYPVLHDALGREEEPSTEEWSSAVEAERSRELHPSPEWADGVRWWWEQMCGGDADKTAALRDMVNVTIPGEPKPETPEQKRLFEQAQRRMVENVAKMLEPSSSPPPDPPKKRR